MKREIGSCHFKNPIFLYLSTNFTANAGLTGPSLAIVTLCCCALSVSSINLSHDMRSKFSVKNFIIMGLVAGFSVSGISGDVRTRLIQLSNGMMASAGISSVRAITGDICFQGWPIGLSIW